MNRPMLWSMATVALLICLVALAIVVAPARTAPASSPVADITHIPYAASIQCRPDGCTVLTGLIEVGTRVLRNEYGTGCVLRTVTLDDTASLSVPIVETIRTEPDGTLMARVQGFTELPVPRVRTVEYATACQ